MQPGTSYHALCEHFVCDSLGGDIREGAMAASLLEWEELTDEHKISCRVNLVLGILSSCTRNCRRERTVLSTATVP